MASGFDAKGKDGNEAEQGRKASAVPGNIEEKGNKAHMNYKPAIEAAMNGEESGFSFLYETTYRDMYYLALKYMKNEDVAQDVLQEAYLKAWQALPTLKEPDRFPAWLGRIVANTAKNELVKKKPLLFSETEQESGDGESYVYELEDENVQYQPELNYSAEETRTLVREMIDSLSDEQRLCVLMHYLDGQSVADIAKTFDISENTVKSRLLYGRKALKAKAEKLKKDGYELYGVAPTFLLLGLLKTEKTLPVIQTAAQSAVETSAAVSRTGETKINMPKAGNANSKARTASRLTASHGTQTASKVAGAAGKGAAAFFHTAAGKAVIALVATAVVGGGTAAAVLGPWEPKAEPAVVPAVSSAAPTQAPTAAASIAPSLTTTPAFTPSPTSTSAPEERRISDDEYPDLISGNLTKAELEYTLAYGAVAYYDSELSMEPPILVNNLCSGAEKGIGPIVKQGSDEQYRSIYSLSEVNRLLGSFSDIQLAEEEYPDQGNFGLSISGDSLYFAPATVSGEYKAVITSAEWKENKIKVHFTYSFEPRNPRETPAKTEDKVAVFEPLKSGMYRISEIVDDVSEGTSPTVDESTAETLTAAQAYESILDAAASGEETCPDYEELPDELKSDEVQYMFQDLDGNGSPELIVGWVSLQDQGVLRVSYCQAYSCESSTGGYTVKKAEGSVYTIGDFVMSIGGSGLYSYEFSRMSGEEALYPVTLENGKLVKSVEPECEFIYGDINHKMFFESHKTAQWSAVSDKGLLRATDFTVQ